MRSGPLWPNRPIRSGLNNVRGISFAAHGPYSIIAFSSKRSGDFRIFPCKRLPYGKNQRFPIKHRYSELGRPRQLLLHICDMRREWFARSIDRRPGRKSSCSLTRKIDKGRLPFRGIRPLRSKKKKRSAYYELDTRSEWSLWLSLCELTYPPEIDPPPGVRF